MRYNQLHPLKSAREKRNLTQQMLADFTQMSKATVNRAERGEPISAENRRRICEFFGKSSEELGLVSNSSQLNNIDTAMLSDDGVEDDMNRRQVLQRLGLAGIATVLGTHELLSDEPWKRLSKALSRSVYVDDMTLQHLQAITKSYWYLRASVASQELLSGVLGHLSTVSEMLPTATGSTNRGRLYSIAGEVALIAGQMAFDMGDYAAARSYYKTAAETAAEAQDTLLHAVALARSSFTYTESGQLERALILVQRANDVARHTDNGLSRAWIKVIEAEVYANIHDARLAETALVAAEEMYSQRVASEDVYWTGFNASRLAGYKGICLVRLAKPDEGLVSLEQSLKLMETGALRRRPRILTDMAFAHVQRREIEEACRLASEALTTSRASGNTMVISRLDKLHHALKPWRASAAVRDFDEQLLLA